MKRLLLLAHASVGFIGMAHETQAQLTIQQPAQSQFGVSTSVMVPNRGRIFLGGACSSTTSRTQFTPSLSRPAIGGQWQASGLSLGVRIHDLRAMDEAIRQQSDVVDEETNLWAARLRQRTAPVIAKNATDHNGRQVDQLPSEKAAKFELLAQAAEARGQMNVARLHWRMAAKFGSSIAPAALARLSSAAVTSVAHD